MGELEVSVEFAFHARECGGNDGDGCTASLPVWVHEIASREGKEGNPELFYMDQSGLRENAVISLFAEGDESLLPTGDGKTFRSANQCYEEFMASFVNTFEKYFANGTITTATIGAGPNGELRYPAFPEDVWVFPGVGSFQVNDKYALKALQEYANERNCSDWGKSGPHDAGEVNDFGPVSHFFPRQRIVEDGLRTIFSHVLPRSVDETRGTNVTKRKQSYSREIFRRSSRNAVTEHVLVEPLRV